METDPTRVSDSPPGHLLRPQHQTLKLFHRGWHSRVTDLPADPSRRVCRPMPEGMLALAVTGHNSKGPVSPVHSQGREWTCLRSHQSQPKPNPGVSGLKAQFLPSCFSASVFKDAAELLSTFSISTSAASRPGGSCCPPLAWSHGRNYPQPS
jgi:hypothetical protein